jgi:hypothetical protein
VIVYGVQVPGEEGKCGMAALKSDTNVDLNTLAIALNKELPAYAKPLFIRFVSEFDHTGTNFLHEKQFDYLLKEMSLSRYFQSQEDNFSSGRFQSNSDK